MGFDLIGIIGLVVSSGLLTEGLKWLINRFGGSVPANAIPVIAAILAEAQKVLVPGLENITDAQALVAGAGATGVHQMLFAHNYIKKPTGDGATASNGTKAILPFLLPVSLLLGGCSYFQKPATLFTVETDEGCQALSIMSAALASKQQVVINKGNDGLKSYAIVQTVISTMGKKCQG